MAFELQQAILERQHSLGSVPIKTVLAQPTDQQFKGIMEDLSALQAPLLIFSIYLC